jgi:hypothetical protein
MKDSSIAVAALIVASVAALAGTGQAFVSWNSRNNTLKATLLAAAVQKCSEAIVASQWLTEFYGSVADAGESGAPFPPEEAGHKAMNELIDKLASMDLLLTALDPKAGGFIPSMVAPMSESLKIYNRARATPQTSLQAELNQLKEAASNLNVAVGVKCHDQVRLHIFG